MASNLWRLVAWASTVGVAVLCLLPGPNLPDAPVMSHDKVLHAVAFFVVALAWRRSGLGLLPTLLVSLALGGGTELAQHYLVRGRTGEWADLAADSVGIVLGLGAAALLPRLRGAQAR